MIPVAERAIETGSLEELVGLLSRRVEDEVRERLHHVMELKARVDGDIDANRAYVEAKAGAPGAAARASRPSSPAGARRPAGR